MTFARNLDALMKMKGVNANEIARVASVSPSTVSRWLHRNVVPSVAKINALCLAAGLEPDDLVSETAGLEVQMYSGAPREVATFPIFNADQARAIHADPTVRATIKTKESLSVSRRGLDKRCSDAYYVAIPDASMSPEMPKGDLVLISRNYRPTENSYVAIDYQQKLLIRRWREGNDAVVLTTKEFSDERDIVVNLDEALALWIGTVIKRDAPHLYY